MPAKRNDIEEESAAEREIAFTRVTLAWVLVLVILYWITSIPLSIESRSVQVLIGGSLGGGDASAQNECAEDTEIVRASLAMPQEFDAPRTMVWEAWTDPKQFEITTTFGDGDGKTRLTMRMVFVPAEAQDQNVWEYGSIEGGKQTLQRLVEHLSARFAAKNEEE